MFGADRIVADLTLCFKIVDGLIDLDFDQFQISQLTEDTTLN